MKKIVTLMLSLMCVALCAISCSSSSSPSSVVEQQMKAIQAGDYEKVTELFYFEEGNAEEGKQMLNGLFAKMSGQIEAKEGIKSYEITSEEISEDGTTAKVKVSVTYGNGTTEEQSMNTAMYDGKWYLHFGK